ncbi:MAG: amidohydrolase family protein [Spirochaetales bacterium]|nr:amidohydrolase family protein [Spirochaetales bacterium]
MRLQGIDPATGSPLEVSTSSGAIARIESPPGGVGVPDDDLSYLCHGFLDMQVNGFRGDDYSDEKLDSVRIRRLVEGLASAGVTQHIPTIVTRPKAQILDNLRAIAKARRDSRTIASAIPGVHIEGPFISGEDGPRGAHDPRYVRDPDYDEFLEWQEAAEGLIKIVTLAPERGGALEFIRKVATGGCVVAIGHSAASPEIIREAISAGCSLSTHLGNGSHATLPRLRNYLWEQLAADELSAGIIADGFHVPPSVLKVFARAKGLDKLVLVSDVAAPAGLEPGRLRWGNLEVELFPDGHIGLAGTSFLAGAGHLLDWDIPTFMRSTEASLAETIALCTKNPARILSLGEQFDVLSPGAPADMVLFRLGKTGEPLAIKKTVIAGETVYENTSTEQ